MMHTFQPGGIYRHYKGNMYKALYVALHTETEEPLAIYQALYGDEKIWARPLEMFLDEVILSDGSVVPRFELVEEIHKTM